MFLPPVVVTAQLQTEHVTRALQLAGIAGDILVEPEGKNTAPAIASALAFAAQKMLAPIVLVIAADHYIPDAEAFHASLQDCVEAVSEGQIVTFGVRPSEVNSGYGYIETGRSLCSGVRTIKRFIEKPDAILAKKLIEEGCLWNSGNFLFDRDTMLAELRNHLPEVASLAAQAVLHCVEKVPRLYLLAQAPYGQMPSVSIDVGVVEKSANVVCNPVSYEWSDMGSWNALWRYSKRDDVGNSTRGTVTLKETANSLVYAQGPRVVVIGMDDVAVVTTRDAVLVSRRDTSAALTTVVEAMRTEPAQCHLTVAHDPGEATSSPVHCQRRVVLESGSAVPVLPRSHGSYWLLAQGCAEIHCDTGEVIVLALQPALVPAGRSGRLVNSGDGPCLCFELALHVEIDRLTMAGVSAAVGQ